MRYGIFAKFILISLGLFTLVISAAIGLYSHHRYENRLAEEVTSLAASAYALSRPLAALQSGASQESLHHMLAVFRGNRLVDCVEARDRTGRTVANWPVADCLGESPTDSRLSLPIAGGPEALTLELAYDTRWMEDKITKEIYVMVSAALAAAVILFASSAIAFHLSVGRGLKTMMKALRQRAESGRWRLVRWANDDEIGRLAQAVNLFIRGESRRKAQAREMEKAIARSRAETKAKSDLLSNVSHELRTPLHAVTGTVHLLRNQPHTLSQQQHLDRIQHSLAALQDILFNLIDCADLDDRTKTLENRPFSLREVVEHILSSEAPKADQKSLTFYIKSGFPEDIAFHGDPQRLGQIIANLVDNAIKFTPSGQVALDLQPAPKGREGLVITVTDSGPGIPAAAREAVLQLFTRRLGEELNIPGLGLGLPIAVELVQRMGGQLDILEAPGGGCRVEVQLPLMVCKEDGAEDARSLKPILVVDDSETNLLIAEAQLSALGYVCDVASSGEDAIVKCRQKKYAAVLMDLRMPGMDGIETARHLLRLSDSQQPVIPLTANVTAELQQRCQANGMTGFLCKPLEQDKLASALARWA